MREFPIDSYNSPPEQVEALLVEFLPKMEGATWLYHDHTIHFMCEDWLQGRKPTLSLIRERAAVLREFEDRVKVAIAQVESELGGLA